MTLEVEADVRFDLRTALVPLGEWGRTRGLLDEAEALAEAIGDQRRLGRALDYKVIQFWVADDLAAALQAGLRALAIGEAESDVALRVVANGYLGMVYVSQGAYREAVRHGEAALVLIPEGLAQERFDQATIQGSQVRFTLAMALGGLGRFADALERLREAMHLSEEAGHVYSLLFPLFGVGTLMLDQGDFASAVAPLERGLELCRTREVPLLFHDFAWTLGTAYHGTDRRTDGVALMEDAVRGIAERNQRWSWWAGRVRSLGGAYLLDGRLADATRIAQEGLAAARQRGHWGVEGQLLQLLGDIATHPDQFDTECGETYYQQALALAKPRGMRPLVAHCHLGLGKLYRRTDNREQAQEHLATATTMYREMDMTYWLAEAEVQELG